MAKGVQFRRGTTVDHSIFTGAEGEITIDTDKDVAVIHDGSTLGGHEQVGVAATQRITNKDIEATTLIVSGIATANKFNGSGQNITNLPIVNYTIPYSNYSGLSQSSQNISGISTYVQTGITSSPYTSGGGITPYFGKSIAISNNADRIYISDPQQESLGAAGVVYAFDRDGVSDYNLVGIITGIYANQFSDQFGHSVASSKDGNRLVVGARYDEPFGAIGSQTASGQAYYFERDGNNFNLVGIVTSTNISLSGEFGYSVAISADGSTFAVGAPKDDGPNDIGTDYGSVHVYDVDGDTITLVSALYGSLSGLGDEFGQSVAMSADGKTIVVGAPRDEIGTSNTGSIYVFERVGNTITEVANFKSSTSILNSEFGETVAISNDGTVIAVGARANSTNQGYVTVFEKTSAGTYTQLDSFYNLFPDINDWFGASLAMTPDGNILVVGAPIDEYIGGTSSSGLVYVYKRQGRDYKIVCILNGDLTQSDNFGVDVNITDDGKTIFVSAPNDEIAGTIDTNYGLVYRFDLQTETYLYADNSGNIGIGTATPSEKLEVTGNLKTTGNIISNGSISLPVGFSSVTSKHVYADRFYESAVPSDTYFGIKNSLVKEFRYHGHGTYTDAVTGWSFNVQESSRDIYSTGDTTYLTRPSIKDIYFNTYFTADTAGIYFDLSPYMIADSLYSYHVQYDGSGVYSTDGGVTGTYYNMASGYNGFYWNGSNWAQISGHAQYIASQTSSAFPPSSRYVLSLYSNGTSTVPQLRLFRANVSNAAHEVYYTIRLRITES